MVAHGPVHSRWDWMDLLHESCRRFWLEFINTNQTCKHENRVTFPDFAHAELSKEREIQLKMIGRRWRLTDAKGHAWTSDDFKGKSCIIYNGLTYCADSPVEIEKMTAVVEGLGKHRLCISVEYHRITIKSCSPIEPLLTKNRSTFIRHALLWAYNVTQRKSAASTRRNF